MYCQECGAKLEEGAKVCKECYASVVTFSNDAVVNESLQGEENVKNLKTQTESKGISIHIIISYIIGAVTAIVTFILRNEFARAKFSVKDYNFYAFLPNDFRGGICMALAILFFVNLLVIFAAENCSKNKKILAVVVNVLILAFCLFLVFYSREITEWEYYNKYINVD